MQYMLSFNQVLLQFESRFTERWHFAADSTEHGVDPVNQMADASHHGQRTVSELVRANALIDLGDFGPAASIYQFLLTTDLADDFRIEAQTNLVAALCAMAQDESTLAETGLAQLKQAEAVQIELLKSDNQRSDKARWASSRANLALIYLARYRITRHDHEILMAHMALDGAESVLRQSTDTELLNWVRSIRDYLVELRERRISRR